MATPSARDDDHNRPKKKKWTRQCGRRVKTGCRTCKVRRLKCDEHKPECFRCQISGMLCDGYEDPDRMIDRRRRGAPKSQWEGSSTPSSPSSSSSVGGSPPSLSVVYLDVTGDPDERRSFHHFRVRTADDLSGSFDSNFWNRLVLQLSHTEPAIKHALIALGAAHENYQAGRVDSSTQPGLALKQYNRAISKLQSQLARPSRRDTEVTLICCVLFVCFESIQGNYDAALLHLKSGLDILKGQNLASENRNFGDLPYLDAETDKDDLIELFTRLDISASAFSDTEPPQLAMRLSEHLPDLTADPLRDLAQAHKHLQRLENMSIHMALVQAKYRDKPFSCPIEEEIERVKLICAIREWGFQYDALLKSPAMVGLTGRDLQGAFMLIILQKTILIILEVSPSSDVSQFNAYEADFESIVSIAAWIAGSNPSLPEAGPTSAFACGTPPPDAPVVDLPIFTADIGILAPLYYVSLRCPNPVLRARAIEILKIPRREGLWDSELIYRIAMRVQEEEGRQIMDAYTGSVLGLGVALGATPDLPEYA